MARARAVFGAMLSALWLGCAGPPQAEPDAAPGIEVVDDAGQTVRLDSPARRVVSLVPARTDIVLALAGPDPLIARTQYDQDPRLAHLPSVGNALTPSVEWIAAQRPDLVIAWPDERSRAIVGRVAELGIAIYASRVQTLEDVERSIANLGRLLGREAAADSLLARIAADHARVRDAVGRRDTLDVLYLIGLDPIMAAGAGNYLDELIRIAGGRNIFSDAGAMWPQVSLEEIVRRDPDVILVADSETPPGPASHLLADRAGWRDLTAVHERRVFALDADIFNRPGVSVGEAALRLAALLHPDTFANRR